MAGFLELLPLLVAQQLGPQVLARRPETEQLTTGEDQVEQYDRVMTTKLVLAYMAGLDVIRRVRDDSQPRDALDLASGPGHFTLCLARYFDYAKVRGIDLSSPMVNTANRNAAQQSLPADVRFLTGDITRLDGVESGSVDLCTLTEGAHHLPTIDNVRQAIREMDRVTRDSGMILLMDLVRLRTDALNERYVSVLGHDYVSRGLPAFLEDFRQSMFASWTPTELHAAIPRDSERWWFHLVPRGLPTIQMIVGLPVGRRRLFLRPGWSAAQHPIAVAWAPRWRSEVGPAWSRETLFEYRMMQLTLRIGSRRLVPPGRTA